MQRSQCELGRSGEVWGSRRVHEGQWEVVEGRREGAHGLSGRLSSTPNFVHSWLAVMVVGLCRGAFLEFLGIL